MTPQKAIETLNVAIAEVEWNYPMDYAVAFEKAVEALEKQIPKKATEKTTNRGIDISGEYDIDFDLCCPVCGAVVGTFEVEENEYFYKCCPDCGQALDWGGFRMTDAEIIKALEVCVGIHNDCEDCPLLEHSQATDECMTELMNSALDLISRQRAEIEKLTNHIIDVTKLMKAEGRKEIAKFLIDKADSNTILISDLPDLVKEMEGATK